MSWLVDRLTPYRRAKARWVELAEAIEEFYDTFLYPEILALRNCRSVYTANAEDLKRIVSGLGGYFEQSLSEENVQMAVAVRRLELNQKETYIPMARTLQRIGIPESAWVPLYYPGKDVTFNQGIEYGPGACFTALELRDQGVDVNASPVKLDGTWQLKPGNNLSLDIVLTSRGVVEVDSSTDPGLLPILEERVALVKPKHIIFEGYRVGFSAAIGELVLTDWFLSFISDYKTLYTFDANVLSAGDDYENQNFSWPSNIKEGFPVPLFAGLGSGGHAGQEPSPENGALTSLIREVERVAVFSVSVIDQDTLEIVVRVAADSMNGQIISEVGLFDSFGQLIAIKHYAPITKTPGAVLNFRLRFTNLTTI